MAATQATLVNGAQITVANIPTALYSSPTSSAPTSGKGTIISAFTISNSALTSVTYKCWVVPSGSSVGDAFLLVPERMIKTLKTDVPYEVVSHFMPANSILYVECNTAAAVNVRVSGVELTLS